MFSGPRARIRWRSIRRRPQTNAAHLQAVRIDFWSIRRNRRSPDVGDARGCADVFDEAGDNRLAIE